jgi:excisionase family DNA binding protein
MKQLLTTSELAKLLNVHPETAREWAHQGRIRYSRTPGGHLRFSSDEAESLLAQQQATMGNTPMLGATGDGRDEKPADCTFTEAENDQEYVTYCERIVEETQQLLIPKWEKQRRYARYAENWLLVGLILFVALFIAFVTLSVLKVSVVNSVWVFPRGIFALFASIMLPICLFACPNAMYPAPELYPSSNVREIISERCLSYKHWLKLGQCSEMRQSLLEERESVAARIQSQHCSVEHA